MLQFFSWLLICGITLTSCNSALQQEKEQLLPKKFCLDIEATQKINGIKLGAGSLTLNDDKTFVISNDSLRFSNIVGTWDVWREGPAGKNYILKPDNHIRQVFNTERIEVKIEGTIYTLMFTVCKIADKY